MMLNYNPKEKSWNAFYDFFMKHKTLKNYLYFKKNATVIYTADGNKESFENQSVSFRLNSSHELGTVNLDDFNTNLYYTEFRTDYQDFKFQKNQLIITGSGDGKKSFTEYKIVIIIEQD